MCGVKYRRSTRYPPATIHYPLSYSISRRLAEFRVLNLDIGFDVGKFYLHREHRGDNLQRMGHLNAAHVFILLKIRLACHLALGAFMLGVLAHEQTGGNVEV